MEEINILTEIGLTKGQAKVYLALISLGQSSTGQIVKEAKVARSKVYEMLDKLIEKGLVNYVIKENTKYFDASNPSQISKYLKEKKLELIKKRKN